MNKPMVSVVIPVYNAGKYLKPAIESIIHQTYKDFELILVDDGATDGSGGVCDQFATKYNNITVVHEKNSGISIARNTGIEHSKGTYIAFCDHDDEYSLDYLSKSVEAITDTNSDLLKFNYQTIEIIDGNRIESVIKGSDGLMTLKNLLSDYLAFNQCIRALWNGLYKADIIKSNNITFDPFYKTGVEDYDFNLQYLRHCKRIEFIEDTLFFHYKRENQSADAKFSLNKLESWVRMQKKEKDFLLQVNAADVMLLQSKMNYLLSILNCLNSKACHWNISQKQDFLKKYATDAVNLIDVSTDTSTAFRKRYFFKWVAWRLFEHNLFFECLLYMKTKETVWSFIHKKR